MEGDRETEYNGDVSSFTLTEQCINSKFVCDWDQGDSDPDPLTGVNLDDEFDR